MRIFFHSVCWFMIRCLQNACNTSWEGRFTSLNNYIVDQVGLIAGRLTSSNTRRIFHIMSRGASIQHPVIPIMLEHKKAFDKIQWLHLFNILWKIGFGQTCIQWIKALYCNPSACVKTNGNQRSSHFPQFRSTRQSFPASPVESTVALEPLDSAIRDNQSCFSGAVGGRTQPS